MMMIITFFHSLWLSCNLSWDYPTCHCTGFGSSNNLSCNSNPQPISTSTLLVCLLIHCFHHCFSSFSSHHPSALPLSTPLSHSLSNFLSCIPSSQSLHHRHLLDQPYHHKCMQMQCPKKREREREFNFRKRRQQAREGDRTIGDLSNNESFIYVLCSLLGRDFGYDMGMLQLSQNLTKIANLGSLSPNKKQ